jgi:hypothetical protein
LWVVGSRSNSDGCGCTVISVVLMVFHVVEEVGGVGKEIGFKSKHQNSDAYMKLNLFVRDLF